MTTAGKVTIRRRMAGFLAMAAALGGFGAGLLRLTVRDRIPFVATVHHASPNVVIAAIALLLALGYRRAGQGRRALGLALLGALFAARTLVMDVARGEPAPVASDVVRVASWNVARASLASTDRIAQRAALIDADLIVLLEANDALAHAELWRQRLPGHAVVPLGGQMVAMARGSVRVADQGSLRGGGRYRILDVTLRQRRLAVLVVDVAASPLLDRSRPIAHVRYLAGHLPDEMPRLVLGDFNTPHDSLWLDPLRAAGWQHAHVAAGRGWTATWPMPLPVLALDQIWGAPDVRFTQAGAATTWLSDHRIVIAELTLGP